MQLRAHVAHTIKGNRNGDAGEGVPGEEVGRGSSSVPSRNGRNDGF